MRFKDRTRQNKAWSDQIATFKKAYYEYKVLPVACYFA